jgi:hypothetical protein
VFALTKPRRLLKTHSCKRRRRNNLKQIFKNLSGEVIPIFKAFNLPPAAPRVSKLFPRKVTPDIALGDMIHV